jgi:HPt (histidine-containing phosphotransfer) domain-containing protein
VSARDRPLRFLLVEGGETTGAALVARLETAIASEVDVVRASTTAEALQRLVAGLPVDVVLLDPEVVDLTVPEAFAAFHEGAPGVPVVVLTGIEGDHLALAIAAVTRSPRSAAAGARRVAALLPAYLSRRDKDVDTLLDALAREDFETIARTGHNLRGNGVSFGFPELRAVGERIEADALARNASGLRDPIAHLQAYMDRIFGRYRSDTRAGLPASRTRVRTTPPDDADAERKTEGER